MMADYSVPLDTSQWGKKAGVGEGCLRVSVTVFVRETVVDGAV